MNKLPFSGTSLLAIAMFAVISSSAMTSSFALAAPQDDIFSRPSDKKDAIKENATGESSGTTETAELAATSVTKESKAKIEQQSDGWFTISDDESMVDVRLPSKPTYKEFTWSPIAGREQRVNHIYNSLAKKGQISVDYSWWDMHEAPTTNKELKEALDGAVKGSVVNVFGELTRMDKIKLGKVQGREFDFNFTMNLPDGKTPKMSGQSRVFIKNNRRYQITVISYAGKEDEVLTKKLFDSLNIK